LKYSREQAEAAGKAKAELIAGIERARTQFWATYPNKPGALKARDEFAKWLFYKDFYYLRLSLMGSLQSRDLTARRGPDFMAHILDLSVGLQTVDGGIRQSAKPEFADWVAAIAAKVFEGHTADTMDNSFIRGFEATFTGPKFWKAMATSEKEYQPYVIERDWWEFDSVGRIPAGYDEPDSYGALLYNRWDKLKMSTAIATYKSMSNLLGPAIVRAAAKAVHDAPKDADGGLRVTVPEPYMTTPGGSRVLDDSVPMPEKVIGTYGDPVKAMEILATQGDDRRYLLYLLTDENIPNRGVIDRATQWTFAGTAYKRLLLAFGEQDVLQAAHLVRLAKKRMTDGHVMDPKAIGARRVSPFASFSDILTRKNPRGYVRSILIFSGKLDSPAAVDSAYKKLVAEHGEANVIECARRMSAEQPYPIERTEIETLRNALSRGAAEAETPPTPQVDDPNYLAWKGYAPGAKATYAYRNLRYVNPQSNQFAPSYVSIRQTYTLRYFNTEMARLWLTDVVYDYPGGVAHPPHDTDLAYGPKRPPLSGTPIKSGNQMLLIGGRNFATRWVMRNTRGYGCGGTVTLTIWTSNEVPGGLVRKTEDNNCPNARVIRETILESFQGSRAGAEATWHATPQRSGIVLAIPGLPPASAPPATPEKTQVAARPAAAVSAQSATVPRQAATAVATPPQPATVRRPAAAHPQESRAQRAAEQRKLGQELLACEQQALKDHPEHGSAFTKAMQACWQQMRARQAR
jgi:hypothetical protein